ncbi:hypothetical protein IQ06DRAFT_294352 [Phaeosphaeriaceae sp. SRC1lsM3a]|nr:hypothetical protein IQ06DRAFT_294352 [Stagonospora sp. SRC1lsM3a]
MSPESLPQNPTPPPWFSSTLSFYLDWAIRLLSLIAALLFGIWAPLAYTATLVANRDSDAFQAALSQRLDDLSAMQRIVHERLHELEMLKVWEFCAGMGREVGACKALGNATVEKLERVVGNAFEKPIAPEPTGIASSSFSSVVSRTMSSTATTVPTTTATPTPSRPVFVGEPAPGRRMDLRGLGAAAGVLGFVALLAVMCMRSRSSAYRTYHRV